MQKAKGRWKKCLTQMNKVCEARWFPFSFVIVAALFLLFFSPSTSPLFTFEGLDSAVFKSMGQAILKGKVLYRDIFDNKGPILYLANALGLLIAGRFGIFLLQIVGLSFALLFMYKMARLFCGELWSLLSLAVSLLLLSVFFEEGNQCEEWMLYGFAPVLYLSMKWYCDLQTDKARAFDRRRMIRDCLFYGLFFGYALFIRPNDAVGFAGGQCLAVAVVTLLNKKWNSIYCLVMGFVAGTIIVATPIVLWFLLHDALLDLWNGMFGVNMGYVGGVLSFLTLPIVKIPLLLCVLTMCVVAYCRGGKTFLVMVACPLCLMFLLIGHQMFYHYYIVFIPYVTTGLACARKVPVPTAVLGAMVIFLSQPMDYDGRHAPLIRQIRHQFSGRNAGLHLNQEQQSLLREGELLVSHIPEEERDFVWNDISSEYQLFPIFPHNGIVQCNRQVFDFGDNCVYQKYIHQTLSSAIELPLWVVSSSQIHDPLLADDCSPYCMVSKTEHYTLYHLMPSAVYGVAR